MPRERQNQIKFYLDDKELQELKKNIYKSNLSQSDYLRKVVLNKKIIVIDELKDMYLELKRIGNNLNQITKIVNSGQLVDIYSLSQMRMNHEKLITEIVRALKVVNK